MGEEAASRECKLFPHFCQAVAVLRRRWGKRGRTRRGGGTRCRIHWRRRPRGAGTRELDAGFPGTASLLPS